jgi:hypothetical protein
MQSAAKAPCVMPPTNAFDRTRRLCFRRSRGRLAGNSTQETGQNLPESSWPPLCKFHPPCLKTAHFLGISTFLIPISWKFELASLLRQKHCKRDSSNGFQ